MIKPRPKRPTATRPDAPEAAAPQSEGDALGQQIGPKLREMFEDIVAEPVPAKFRQLLDELERKSRKP
jgi:hypothetical protein